VIGLPTPWPTYMRCPRGPRPGATRPDARFFEQEGGFTQSRAATIAALRDELKREPTPTEIWSRMGVPSATYYRYMARENPDGNK
jgi:hypothetical protein